MDSATVAECNLDLLKNAKHSDVVFIVGVSKERISCHQLFLMARSPVFEVMFADRWTNFQNLDNGVPSVQVPDVEPSVFQQFLRFIYGDVFTTKISEAIQILHVAHKYQVSQLVQKCELLMQTDIQLKDAIQIYQTARHFDLASLKLKAADLMANGFSELVNDPSFMSIDEASLVTLLSGSDLVIDEMQLFNALLRWSCQKLKSPTPCPSDQRKVLEKLLPLVRFPLMNTQDFAMSVVTKNILTPEESVKIFSYMNFDQGARAGLREKLGFPWKGRSRAEHTIELYNFSPGRAKSDPCPLLAILSREKLASRPNHDEAIQFSLQWGNVNTIKSPQLYSVALASVALRGPNYASPIHGNHDNLPLESAWIVTTDMQVIKKDSTRDSSIADCICLFEKKNIEIFADRDTNLTIAPSLELESDGEYQIYISFSGPVSPSYLYDTAEHLTEARSFQTDKSVGTINLSEVIIFTNTSSPFDFVRQEYSSHCIRSMKVHVCSA